MEGSVLSFLKAEWKVSDTGSAHWASSLHFIVQNKKNFNASHIYTSKDKGKNTHKQDKKFNHLYLFGMF